jgi:hypothetical protein
LLAVLLPDKHSLHPAIHLLTTFARKPDFLAGLNKPAHRFQTQLLWFVHADVQSPACLTLQDSSCVGKEWSCHAENKELTMYVNNFFFPMGGGDVLVAAASSVD